MFEAERKINYNIIRSLYKADKELCDKYHVIAPATYKQCAVKTYSDLKSAENYKFYVIYSGNRHIAYYGIQEIDEIKFLTGFCIHPKHRNKETKDYLFKCIANKTNNNYICGIYSNNVRAQKFLKKNGFSFLKKYIVEDKVALIYIKD